MPATAVVVTGHALPPILFAACACLLFARRAQIVDRLASVLGPSPDMLTEPAARLLVNALGVAVLVQAIDLLMQLGNVFSEGSRGETRIFYAGVIYGGLPDLILFTFAWRCLFRSQRMLRMVLRAPNVDDDFDAPAIGELALAIGGIYLLASVVPAIVSTTLHVAWETWGTENTILVTLLGDRWHLLFEVAGEVVQVIAGVLLFLGRTRLMRWWRVLRPMAAG